MLDNDLIRLQSEVNTVLEYRQREEILEDVEEKEALKRKRRRMKRVNGTHLGIAVLALFFTLGVMELCSQI